MDTAANDQKKKKKQLPFHRGSLRRDTDVKSVTWTRQITKRKNSEETRRMINRSRSLPHPGVREGKLPGRNNKQDEDCRVIRMVA